MSTKPTNDAIWDSNGTNLIAPTGGHKTDGFAVNEVPSSSEINGQLQRIGLWTKWLLDGDLGDLTFDNITVTGATTYTGTVDYSLTANTNDADLMGDGSTNNLHTAYVTATPNDWNLNGIVGGVNGREFDIINSGAEFFWLTHENGTTTAANRITIPDLYLGGDEDFLRVYPGGRVRLRYDGAVSRWRVISASGCYRCTKLIIGSGAAYTDDPSASHVFVDSNGYWSISGISNITFPITVPLNTIIFGGSVHIQKNTSNATTLTGGIYSNAFDSTAAVSLTTTAYNGNSTGFHTINLSVGDTIVDGTKQYWVNLVSSGGTTPSADNVMFVVVDVWVPV